MGQYQYLVVLTNQSDGGYTVTVPSLPGCVSEGETKAEAIRNIKDAIEGYLVVARKHNLPMLSGLQQVEQVEIVSGLLKNA